MTTGSQRPPDDDDEGSTEPERKRLFERAVPDAIKRLVERAVETGVEKLVEGPENLRQLVGEMKLPKEVAGYVFQQIDDTKKGLYRVVAKEIRDVLEHTNFADEIARVLTKLSFEISTQVRFVPNPVTQAGNYEAAEGEAAGDASPNGEGGADAGHHAEAGGARPAPRRHGLPRPEVVSKVVMRARDRLDRKKEGGA
jgi:hypothetical protein